MVRNGNGNGVSTFMTAFIGSIAGALVLAIIGFFVWLATISNRVTVLEELRTVDQLALAQAERERTRAAERVEAARVEAARVIDEATKEAQKQLQQKQEKDNDLRREDIRELRAKVFK